jgi:hypothetical protein
MDWPSWVTMGFGFGRSLSTLLFGVTATDPITLAAVGHGNVASNNCLLPKSGAFAALNMQ